jgi:hypothetical protein
LECLLVVCMDQTKSRFRGEGLGTLFALSVLGFLPAGTFLLEEELRSGAGFSIPFSGENFSCEGDLEARVNWATWSAQVELMAGLERPKLLGSAWIVICSTETVVQTPRCCGSRLRCKWLGCGATVLVMLRDRTAAGFQETSATLPCILLL